MSTPDRRDILLRAASLAGTAAGLAGCATGVEAGPPPPPPAPAAPAPAAASAFGDEDLLLWPGGPPGAPAQPVEPANPQGVAIPEINVFRPASPSGVALVIFQGGGYVRVARGPGIGRWFAARGITAFDVRYRLPGGGWAAGPDVALQDAQRAVRFVRANAARYGVDPAKIGVAGFSAGGHVAGSVATRFGADLAPPGSDLADISARPDFALLACPVVTLQDPYAHGGSRKEMFGPSRDPAALALRSHELQVTAQTPPCCLIHAADDRTVPVQNSLMLFNALLAAKVPAEMHVFETGGHNMGQGFQPGTPLSAYPGLWMDWITRRFLSSPAP